jgi:hypothetical protein
MNAKTFSFGTPADSAWYSAGTASVVAMPIFDENLRTSPDIASIAFWLAPGSNVKTSAIDVWKPIASFTPFATKAPTAAPAATIARPTALPSLPAPPEAEPNAPAVRSSPIRVTFRSFFDTGQPSLFRSCRARM